MASKLGSILSIFLIFFAFIIGCDFVNIQLIFADIDATSSSISYKIAKNGGLPNNIKENLENQFNVNLRLEDPNKEVYEKGEVVAYFISREYKPLIMSNKSLEISIKRFAVISQFN